jgi:hypothetical protein
VRFTLPSVESGTVTSVHIGGWEKTASSSKASTSTAKNIAENRKAKVGGNCTIGNQISEFCQVRGPGRQQSVGRRGVSRRRAGTSQSAFVREMLSAPTASIRLGHAPQLEKEAHRSRPHRPAPRAHRRPPRGATRILVIRVMISVSIRCQCDSDRLCSGSGLARRRPQALAACINLNFKLLRARPRLPGPA